MNPSTRPHDGESVRLAAAKKGLSNTEMGKVFNCSANNVRDMYTRESWTTVHLHQASKFFQQDFFQAYRGVSTLERLLDSDNVIGIILKPGIASSIKVAESILNAKID